MKTRDVVRLIVYDYRDGEIVYLLLKAKKGYWQNPQGGIDYGETSIQAGERENYEETGIHVEVDSLSVHYTEYITERKGEIIHTKLTSFAARGNSLETVILSEEDGHTDYQWANEAETVSLFTPKYPEQLEVFNVISAYIKNKLNLNN